MLTAPEHSSAYRVRRFWNWFPLGLTYAFLYWGRYNLTVAKTSLGDLMSNEDFGNIFGAGTFIYAIAFLINGPLTDKIGGKRAILIAATGAASANLAMGWVLRGILTGPASGKVNIAGTFSVLYAINMYFQSFGAVSIVKVNAHWFHVRERGGFSGIFGAMISSGIFFAFDVSGRVLKEAGDAKWWVFFAPALALAIMGVIEVFLLRDRPSQAGHQDFDTGDASSGEEHVHVPVLTLMKRVLTHPIILTVALVEFCTGVLRNGVMHWFPIYAAATVEKGGLGLPRDHLLRENWGLLLMIAGIIGGNVAGWVSDKVYNSRRGPAAGGLYFILFLSTLAMVFAMGRPWGLGAIIFVMSTCVIGTHGLLSGTATMDFGGRKGAATAVGMIDGFVYLGTALQSVALGHITSWRWSAWPIFLLPFGVIGYALCRRIWHSVPQGAGAATAQTGGH